MPPASGPLAGGSFTPDGQSFVYVEPRLGTHDGIVAVALNGSGHEHRSLRLLSLAGLVKDKRAHEDGERQ